MLDSLYRSHEISEETNILVLYQEEFTRYGSNKVETRVRIINRGNQGYAVLSQCSLIESNRLLVYERGKSLLNDIPTPYETSRVSNLSENNLYILANSVFWDLVRAEDLESACKESKEDVRDINVKLMRVLLTRYKKRNPGCRTLNNRHEHDHSRFVQDVAIVVAKKESLTTELKNSGSVSLGSSLRRKRGSNATQPRSSLRRSYQESKKGHCEGSRDGYSCKSERMPSPISEEDDSSDQESLQTPLFDQEEDVTPKKPYLGWDSPPRTI